MNTTPDLAELSRILDALPLHDTAPRVATIHDPLPIPELPTHLQGPAHPDDPWQDRALCALLDPWTADRFFFPKPSTSTAPAKRVCDACPVREACLEAAMDEEKAESYRHGVRGGLAPRDRRELARQRRQAADDETANHPETH